MIVECFKNPGVREVYSIKDNIVSKFVKEGSVYKRQIDYEVNEGACTCPAVEKCKHIRMIEGSLSSKGAPPGAVMEVIEVLTGKWLDELQDYQHNICRIKVSANLVVDMIVFVASWRQGWSCTFYLINEQNTKMLKREEVLQSSEDNLSHNPGE